MMTVLAFLAAYGMGVGVTVAACRAVDPKNWQGVDILVGALWPVALPALIMWWSTNAILKSMGGNS
jgi:hypothetical protein